jgi:hypothetical protein
MMVLMLQEQLSFGEQKLKSVCVATSKNMTELISKLELEDRMIFIVNKKLQIKIYTFSFFIFKLVSISRGRVSGMMNK